MFTPFVARKMISRLKVTKLLFKQGVKRNELNAKYFILSLVFRMCRLIAKVQWRHTARGALFGCACVSSNKQIFCACHIWVSIRCGTGLGSITVLNKTMAMLKHSKASKRM